MTRTLLPATTLVLFASCVQPAGPAPKPPNVVLVTIDTLRADRLGSYGYTAGRTPFLDGVAAAGLRFEEAVTHSPLTFPAHVSIMTGLDPSAHGARDNGTYVLDPEAWTLAEALHDAGYRTGAFVGSFVLDAGFGLSQGFDHYDDDMPSQGPLLDYDAQRRADEVAGRAIEWIGSRPLEPFFAWVHLFDPHSPYDPLPPFDELPDRYDGEVAAADAALGRILAELDRLGVRDRTVVIVTSDHGEGLGDHGEREHGLLLYDSVIRVPLILQMPGVEPRVVPHLVGHVDIMPTVLSLAGVTTPPGLRGRDLLSLAQADATAADREARVMYSESWYGRLHFGWSELRSVRADGWKYIDGPTPELYDLRRDPLELRNQLLERPQIAAGLRRELQELARSSTDLAPLAAKSAPDSETLSRLRALGYLSGGPQPETPGGLARPHPRDMLPAFEQHVEGLNAGLALLRDNRPADAVDRFRRVATAQPENFEAAHYLGYALAAAGRHREAVVEYDRALALHPAYALAHFNAARSLAAQGRDALAVERLDHGFFLEPRSYYGLMVAGVIALEGGRTVEAAEAFEQAAEVRPNDPRAHASLAEAYMRSAEYGRAADRYRRLIELGHRPAAAHFNLGVIGELTGDVRQATEQYRHALALDPGLEPARTALDRLR